MSAKFRDCILIHSCNRIFVLITIILMSITVILVMINDSVVGDTMEWVIVSTCECFKEMCNAITKHVGPVAQSVLRLTTGWTVRDRIPEGTIFSPVQTGPGTHPGSCTIGTKSFPRVEAAGAWV